jgi:DNA-directed RNA polymerase subunit RPC12/RpoP
VVKSETIRFVCRHCGTKLRAREREAGEQIRCPRPYCRGWIFVPTPEEQRAEEAQAALRRLVRQQQAEYQAARRSFAVTLLVVAGLVGFAFLAIPVLNFGGPLRGGLDGLMPLWGLAAFSAVVWGLLAAFVWHDRMVDCWAAFVFAGMVETIALCGLMTVVSVTRKPEATFVLAVMTAAAALIDGSIACVAWRALRTWWAAHHTPDRWWRTTLAVAFASLPFLFVLLAELTVRVR